MFAEPLVARIAVLISGNGSNLQALIDAQNRGELAADIALVISNKADAFGLTRARDAGIETAVVAHADYPNREAYDQALRHQLLASSIDLIVLAGFMRILTPAFTAEFAGRMLNIHPSLLPKYPGLHTHKRALEAGDSHQGATVHFVTADLDMGPPVLQGRIRIRPDDTEDFLAKRVLERIEHKIYPLAVKWLAEGRLSEKDGRAYLDRELLPESGLQWPEEEDN